jgi:hypothetical protein
VEQSKPVPLYLLDEAASVSNITLPDYDLDQGDLGGTLSWIPPQDASLVTHYMIYFSEGEDMVNRSQFNFETLSVGNNSITVPINTPLKAFAYIGVYTASSFVINTVPSTFAIDDAFASVSQLSFVDQDLDSPQIGGKIKWYPPLNMRRVILYRAYMAVSAFGGARVHLEHDVPAGTNELGVSVNTPIEAYTHILVYTESTLTEQSTPVSFSLYDMVAYSSNLTFPDLDLDETEIGGTLGWTAPGDPQEVTDYVIYLAKSPLGFNRSYFGTVPWPFDNITVPVNTPLLDFTYWCVYTRSVLVESTRPMALAIFDAFASASSFYFIDKDLDVDEFGGPSAWESPVTYRVVAYNVYIASDAAGTIRKKLARVPVGTNEVDIYKNLPNSIGQFMLVYTESSEIIRRS